MTTEPSRVGELLDPAVERVPERVAVKLRDGSDDRTYAQLHERTTRLANALLDAGLQRGDHVAAWMEDRIEYVELYLAAAKAGLVVAPINARFVAPEAAYQLEDARAAAVVWTPGLDERVAALGPVVSSLTTIRVGGRGAAQHAFEDLISTGDSAPLSAPHPDDVFILGYTSGTTGRPKGAMLTHRSILALGRQNALSFRLSGHVVWGLTGSMSFVAVVPAHVLCCVALGGTLIMMGHYDVPALLDAIERERITFTYVPSPLLREFAEAARARPRAIRSLHSVLHSASRAAPQELRAVFAVVGDRLIEGWGMTEHSGGLATATTPDDYLDPDGPRDVFATAGRAAAGVAVRLVDADGGFLPHDGATVGELVISSPSLMTGYWQRPEATAEALRNGWYHTGDLGTIDAEGYIFIAERRTDLIVSGGMNVYPSEVEQCIAAMPTVAEVAVVGLPHERWGQTVVAAVVADGELTEDDVVAHCRERLASFKKPSRVVLLDELPRTAGMKIARAALREQIAARNGAARDPH
jgi:acyl-CoA synthetase (AMP-forming)/AMP-acid ligase II